jgi:patatin-like phospholipase/acyl hydrolase
MANSKKKRNVDGSPAAARLFAPGKKRILTLDGGGVRGIITIAFLKEIEDRLRKHTGRTDLVLADVFDMIAGTSVGSMLATMLALGMPVKDIEATFRELAPKIFSGRDTIFGQKRFSAVPLVNGVRSIVKEETLGSDKLVTGLAIIAKRVDTGSVWVMSNNPDMPYWNDGDGHDGNRHYKLEMLIRASTAAPFLFTPTELTIHTDRYGKVTKGWFSPAGRDGRTE